MDGKLIDRYAAGGETLQKAVVGLSQQDLLWKPPAEAGIGLWSIQQIVIHLMDSDLIWAARMKSMIAEDDPQILGFDESKFADHLFYEDQDAQIALRLLDLNRRQMARVLRKLPDSAFSRTGQHNERGPITLVQSVHGTVEHLEHHVDFIRKKREKLGKAMKDS
jgi:DinB superfamily